MIEVQLSLLPSAIVELLLRTAAPLVPSLEDPGQPYEDWVLVRALTKLMFDEARRFDEKKEEFMTTVQPLASKLSSGSGGGAGGAGGEGGAGGGDDFDFDSMDEDEDWRDEL